MFVSLRSVFLGVVRHVAFSDGIKTFSQQGQPYYMKMPTPIAEIMLPFIFNFPALAYYLHTIYQQALVSTPGCVLPQFIQVWFIHSAHSIQEHRLLVSILKKTFSILETDKGMECCHNGKGYTLLGF